MGGAAAVASIARPTVGFIGVRTAPPGKRTGHADVPVADTNADITADIPNLVKQALAKTFA